MKKDDVQEQSILIEKRLRIENQFRSGANWFSWIAGLSLINSLNFDWHVCKVLFIAVLQAALVLAHPRELRASEGKVFTILHTNDWHSRMLGFGPNSEYTPGTLHDDMTRGGVARLATLLKRRVEARRVRGPVLVLDGGDFLSGSLFHALSCETGLELRLMGRMGYDAVTLGNHDFDFGPHGLARAIRSALAGGQIPLILAANTTFDASAAGDDALEALAKGGCLRRSAIIERGGLRFGLFGVIGRHAVALTKLAAPLTFDDAVVTAREMVKHLREGKKVDVIIALSHGGVMKAEDGRWGFEDVELARAVPGIDVIVGGHSHTPLEEAIVVDDRTAIVQAGSMGAYLGELVVAVEQGKPRVVSYTLHSIDDTIPGDPNITEELRRFKMRITDRFLKPRGFTFDQPVAETPKTLTFAVDDAILGNLVTDAVRRAAGTDIAFTGNGTIRDDLMRGRTGIQTVADIFRVVPLGMGHNDDEPGYPLIKAYLTGAELKHICEVFLNASASEGDTYFPRISGIRILHNPCRIPMDQVMDIQLGDDERGYRSIDLSGRKDKLYSFACTSYVGKFVWALSELSMGLFDVTPRSADGRPVGKPEEAIIDADPEKSGIQEVKEWHALISHLKSFPDVNGNGIADIPVRGSLDRSRIIARPSWRPRDLFRNATLLMWCAAGLPPILLILLIMAIYWFFRRMARLRSRGK
jgi:5'-nucleotidase